MDTDALRALSKEELIELVLKERRVQAAPVPARPTQPSAEPTAPAEGDKKKKRGRDSFDWGKHEMGQVALKVAYCGWDYFGYASQAYVSRSPEEASLTA